MTAIFNPMLPGPSDKLRRSDTYIRDNFQALEHYLGAANLASGQPMGWFPSGTKLWFYQDTAPPGWTILSGVADCLVGVKGESGATYAAGGATAGTWLTANHVLTVDEMPAHQHTARREILPAGASVPYYNPRNNANVGNDVVSFGDLAGGSQPHNHGDTWRPAAAVGIIAVKT